MHYIVSTLPIASYFLNLGKTRVVYDIIRVPSIPKEVKETAVSLVRDAELANYLGIQVYNGDAKKPEDKQAIFWYAKVLGESGPSQSRIEYYRINASFIDVAELIDFDNVIDEEVYRLCENRKCNPSEDGFTTNAVEFRCSELGVFPTRDGNTLVLKEPISNNEARIIAKHGSITGVDLLAEYDSSYLKGIRINDSQPVMSALAEWDLI